MKTGGRANIAGVRYQLFAAMSLFLQYKNGEFSHIHLEDPQCKDFTLVFKDGKRVICESKQFSKKSFSYTDLKNVLKLLVKNDVVGEDDKVLIVCNRISNELIKDIRYCYTDTIKNKLKQKQYSEAILSKLSKVEFFEIDEEKNKRAIKSLISESLNCWVNDNDLENFISNILKKRIESGSATGSTYSKEDFEKDIKDFKETIRENSDLSQEIRQNFNVIKNFIKGKRNAGNASLSKITQDWDLLRYTVLHLEQLPPIKNLEKLDKIWVAVFDSLHSSSIVNLFIKNLKTENNQKYVLTFLKKYVQRKEVKFYRADFLPQMVRNVLKALISDPNRGNHYLEDAFQILKTLITKNNIFYFERNDGLDRWERDELSGLIEIVYTKSNNKLKKEIYEFITSRFNLIKDGGDYNQYSPKSFYNIIQKWLSEPKFFKSKLGNIIKVISEQYNNYHKEFARSEKFNGWDIVGSGISGWGDDIKLHDLYFVEKIITPAIEEFYKNNKNDGWKFILKECVVMEVDVSAKCPDFLNRSVYKIIIDRYLSGDQKCFDLLSDFIKSRKGLPRKNELIYQDLYQRINKDENLLKSELEKISKIAKIGISDDGIPVNNFLSRIITSLARAGDFDAKEYIEKTVGNKNYYHTFRSVSESLVAIKEFIKSDDLTFAANLLRKMLIARSETIASEDKIYDHSFDIAKVIYQILEKDYESGLEIIKVLGKVEKPNHFLQKLFCFSLHTYGSGKKNNPKLLNKVYDDLIDPMLDSLDKDINKICERFSEPVCREALADFAHKLAESSEIEKALRIVEIFVSDSDPDKNKESEFNEHRRIEEGEETSSIKSVRGYCALTLIACAKLEGRKYLPRIIELTKKLINDDNYYIVQMACLPLSQLMKNRLSVLPSDSNILFFNNNRKTALKMAKDLEKVAFELMDRFLKWPLKVQEAMASSIIKVLDPMRALNETDAVRLIEGLIKFPKNKIQIAAGLFFYYADFRKGDYVKDWKTCEKGLYDDLKDYDNRKIKGILEKTLLELKDYGNEFCNMFLSSINQTLEYLTKNHYEDFEKYEIAAQHYLKLLTKKYEHRIFEISYMIFEKNITRSKSWYYMYLNCLKTEASFYNSHLDDLSQMYHWPSYSNNAIMIKTYETYGREAFLDAYEILLLFPQGLYLYDQKEIIKILKLIPQDHQQVRRIWKNLHDRDLVTYSGMERN
jgi:hypothetical protein